MNEETASNEPEHTYVDPSPATSLYRAHMEAMEPIKNLPEGKSYCVGMEGLELPLLRDLAADFGAGSKKAYVVILHDEHSVYEIYRLPDGSNPKTFYKTQSKTNVRYKASACYNTVNEVKRVCETYIGLKYEDCLKYDHKLHIEAKRQNIISYTYLQRRLISAAAFRNSAEGATTTLRDTIKKLVKDEFLKPIPKEFAIANYLTKGKLFEISFD